jgi:hypothetical protein
MVPTESRLTLTPRSLFVEGARTAGQLLLSRTRQRDKIGFSYFFIFYKGLTKVNETIEHIVDIKQEPNITNTNNEGDDDEDLVESVDDDNESSIFKALRTTIQSKPELMKNR